MKTGILISYMLTLTLLNIASLYPQDVRPIRDDIGYCWQGDQLDLFINWLNDNADDVEFESDNLVAGISPHDDYLYAGKVYFPLLKLIKAKEVVILGVTHGTVKREMNDPANLLILDEFVRWKGPYSDVEISPLREKIKLEIDPGNILISNEAHTIEHSIEGLIPFLQHYNKDVKITPIMITKMSLDKMDSVSNELSEIISNYIMSGNLKLGKDIFFLISNDANHYGEDFDNRLYGIDEKAHRIATDIDKQVADETFNGIITSEKIKSFTEKLWPEAGVNVSCPLWCGRYPVVFGLLTIIKVANAVTGKKTEGKVFKYSDTYTGGVLSFRESKMGITAPFSLKHWVGFLSAGFYLK